MSFKSEFAVDGETYLVLSCNYSLSQTINSSGKPATDVQGGTLMVTVETKESDGLAEWMVNPWGKKNGTITFKKFDQDSKFKEIKFTDGFLVQFTDNFHNGNAHPMTTSIVISAKKIEIGSAAHENPW